MKEKIHQWELDGLGKAPFKVVGIFSLPTPAQGEANPQAHQRALKEIPKGFGIGCCRACGHGLIHNFLIESADRKTFAVGSDCVEKSGDRGLVNQAKALDALEKREARRIARMAEMERRHREIEQQIEDQRRANGGRTNKECFEQYLEETKAKHFAEVQARLDVLANRLQDGKRGFCDSIASDLREGKLPSGRGISLMIEILAKQAGRKGSKAFTEEFARVESLVYGLEEELPRTQQQWEQMRVQLDKDWRNDKDTQRWLGPAEDETQGFDPR